MVNNDRIVPIQKIDFLSMIGTVYNMLSESPISVLAASSIDGAFEVTDDSVTYLANQPVQSLDFADGVDSAEVYFVPAYDFIGFTVNGATATIDDVSGLALDEIQADGITLYIAVLGHNEVTIHAVTPSAGGNQEVPKGTGAVDDGEGPNGSGK